MANNIIYKTLLQKFKSSISMYFILKNYNIAT